jgi:hypothetical protein
MWQKLRRLSTAFHNRYGEAMEQDTIFAKTPDVTHVADNFILPSLITKKRLLKIIFNYHNSNDVPISFAVFKMKLMLLFNETWNCKRKTFNISYFATVLPSWTITIDKFKQKSNITSHRMKKCIINNLASRMFISIHQTKGLIL